MPRGRPPNKKNQPCYGFQSIRQFIWISIIEGKSKKQIRKELIEFGLEKIYARQRIEDVMWSMRKKAAEVQPWGR